MYNVDFESIFSYLVILSVYRANCTQLKGRKCDIKIVLLLLIIM